MLIDISVVIPTLNREKTLKRVLQALIDQEYPKDKYEIVVVDDGCTDRTGEMVGGMMGSCRIGFRTCPSLAYVKQSPGKRGPAGANNLGIKTAAGKYILFMNDDVIADKHLIAEHMKTHTDNVGNGRDRSNIIVQGRVINTSSLEDLGKKTEGYQGGYSDLSFGYFTTWNCSISKELLEKAGLFDEDFKDLCWEDVEFAYRLRKLGVKQNYNKAAFGYHFRHEFSLKQLDWVRTKSINMGRNAMIYYRKHPKLDVKISTESFWLPMVLRSMLSAAIKLIGKKRIMVYLEKLEKQKRHRLFAFFVGLAGKYWYWTGVAQARKQK